MSAYEFTYFCSGIRTACTIIAPNPISAVCTGLGMLIAAPQKIICKPARKS